MTLADLCTVVVFSLFSLSPLQPAANLLTWIESRRLVRVKEREGQRNVLSIDTEGRRCVNASYEERGRAKCCENIAQVLLVDVGFRKPLGSGLILRPRMENLTDINVFFSVCAERERERSNNCYRDETVASQQTSRSDFWRAFPHSQQKLRVGLSLSPNLS